jgi:N-acyl-D-amino-acid deacylase
VRAFLLTTVCVALCGIWGGRAAGQAPTGVPASGDSVPGLAGFDAEMLRFLPEHRIAGAQLAIARGGKLVFSRAYGYAQMENGQCMGVDTLMRIASISKPFTGVAAATLVQAGKLSPDESAFKALGYQPFLPSGAQADPRIWKITVDDLMRHRGGWDREKPASSDPMFQLVRIANEMKVASPPTPEQIVRWGMGRPLDFEPGSTSSYSNFGYCVLGRVIAKKSGVSYEDYVKSAVLAPLGITDMRVGHTRFQERAPGEAGYYCLGLQQLIPSAYDVDSHRPLPSPYGSLSVEGMDANGGWLATASDLVRFASSMRFGRRLLTQQTLTKLLAPPRDFSGSGSYTGCGWQVSPSQSGVTFSHNGKMDGSCGELTLWADGTAIAVLFNTSSRTEDLTATLPQTLRGLADSVPAVVWGRLAELRHER